VAYLGNDLQVAFPTYRNIDDISGSFNGVTTSFPLTVGGVAPIPAPLNSQQCLISVNGVVQRPDDSGAEGFLLSGGNIVFASAPISSLRCRFITTKILSTAQCLLWATQEARR
jgi:hypothetical protein